jgi:hypothetical protein
MYSIAQLSGLIFTIHDPRVNQGAPLEYKHTPAIWCLLKKDNSGHAWTVHEYDFNFTLDCPIFAANSEMYGLPLNIKFDHNRPVNQTQVCNKFAKYMPQLQEANTKFEQIVRMYGTGKLSQQQRLAATDALRVPPLLTHSDSENSPRESSARLTFTP